MAATEAVPGSMTGGLSRSKALHVTLWAVQAVLALSFGMAGVMKLTMPMADLAQMLGWPGAVPPALVRFIGASELAGAIGLIVPAWSRIKPGLTALAGAGLALVMLLAIGFHVSRGELAALPVNLVLGGLAAFVAWGRARKAPIAPR
ncbi:DoxX family protein [Hyalangium gracile]|uniref:DoxX family protein n=1 Tax=Hyalangium gracile TaxID=394092 RepID=UPI001CCBA21F|nr:DoxX family protein [Hyalangium gracile]